ncbi:MAG: DUF2306 domain-containing protein [Pseudomonadota bacterium]
MSLFATLSAAPPAVQIHLLFAFPSLVIGTLVLFWLRPGPWHKRFGYVWVVSMAGLATSGFFIHSDFKIIGPIGPLQAFSVLTLWTLYNGIRCARTGNIAAHRASFEGLWFGGIGLTVLLNFLPGRTMNRAVLGDHGEHGVWVVAVGVPLLVAFYLNRNRDFFFRRGRVSLQNDGISP